MPWIRDRNSNFDVYVCPTEESEGGDACFGRTFNLVRSKDGAIRLACTECDVARDVADVLRPPSDRAPAPVKEEPDAS